MKKIFLSIILFSGFLYTNTIQNWCCLEKEKYRNFRQTNVVELGYYTDQSYKPFILERKAYQDGEGGSDAGKIFCTAHGITVSTRFVSRENVRETSIGWTADWGLRGYEYTADCYCDEENFTSQ